MNAFTKIKDFIVVFGPIAKIYKDIFNIVFIFTIYKRLSKTEFFELCYTCFLRSFIILFIIIIAIFILIAVL